MSFGLGILSLEIGDCNFAVWVRDFGFGVWNFGVWDFEFWCFMIEICIFWCLGFGILEFGISGLGFAVWSLEI